MKYILLLVIFLCINLNVIGEDLSLYDVNYDKPNKTLFYSQEQDKFQEIYLQYEFAISNIEKKIRAEEVQNKIKEIEKIKEELAIKTEKSIQQAREEIYSAEVASVREKELVRLTEELTREITQKLTQEFEEKKDAEISILREQLREEVSVENKSTTQRFLIIAQYVFYVIVVLIFILVILFSARKMKKTKLKKEAEEYSIKNYTEKYLSMLNKLKDNALTIISDEIEKMENLNEKRLCSIAFGNATKVYFQRKKLKSVEDYKKILSDSEVELENYFRRWNSTENREELRGICNNFYSKKNDFYMIGCDISNSFKDREKKEEQDLSDLLKTYGGLLEKYAEQIESTILADFKCKDEENLKKNFSKMVVEYKKLSKQFREGNFR